MCCGYRGKQAIMHGLAREGHMGFGCPTAVRANGLNGKQVRVRSLCRKSCAAPATVRGARCIDTATGRTSGKADVPETTAFPAHEPGYRPGNTLAKCRGVA